MPVQMAARQVQPAFDLTFIALLLHRTTQRLGVSIIRIDFENFLDLFKSQRNLVLLQTGASGFQQLPDLPLPASLIDFGSDQADFRIDVPLAFEFGENLGSEIRIAFAQRLLGPLDARLNLGAVESFDGQITKRLLEGVSKVPGAREA